MKFALPKKIHWSLKLAISVILIFLILWKFPLADIFANTRSADLKWLLLAFFLCELTVLSQAFRWHYLLIAQPEQKPPFCILLRYTAAGYFFNLLAPGGVGGDAYRSVALGRAYNVISGSIASVFISRILGFIALCLLFWFAYPALPSDFRIPKYAGWFMIFVSVFLAAFCAVLPFNRFQKGRVGLLASKLREYRQYPLRIVAAFLGSVFMQILVVLSQFAVFKAVGISIPLSLVFVIVPITVLLTAIPVSFNGVGVREWSMLSLTIYSVNSEQMLASLLFCYGILILQALQGWIVFLYSSVLQASARGEVSPSLQPPAPTARAVSATPSPKGLSAP